MPEPKIVNVELPVTGPLCRVMRRETQMQLETFSFSLPLTFLTNVRFDIFFMVLKYGTLETFDRVDELVIFVLFTDVTPEIFDRMDVLVIFVLFWHVQY